MSWQDIIITIVNLVFAYALIPQVYQGFKDKKGYINFQTGLLNTVGMYLMAIAYFSLNLFFSAIIGNFNAAMWLLLFTQRIIYK
jgi:uncharacterized membrane protein